MSSRQTFEVVYRGISRTLPLPESTDNLICTAGIYFKLGNFSWYCGSTYVPEPSKYPDTPLRDLGIDSSSTLTFLPKFEYCRSCLSQGRIYKVPDSCQVGYCSECLGFEPSEGWNEDYPEFHLSFPFMEIVPGMNNIYLMDALWGFLLTNPDLMKEFRKTMKNSQLTDEKIREIILTYLPNCLP